MRTKSNVRTSVRSQGGVMQEIGMTIGAVAAAAAGVGVETVRYYERTR